MAMTSVGERPERARYGIRGKGMIELEEGGSPTDRNECSHHHEGRVAPSPPSQRETRWFAYALPPTQPPSQPANQPACCSILLSSAPPTSLSASLTPSQSSHSPGRSATRGPPRSCLRQSDCGRPSERADGRTAQLTALTDSRRGREGVDP